MLIRKEKREKEIYVVEKTFRTNVLSTFAMTKFALPHSFMEPV